MSLIFIVAIFLFSLVVFEDFRSKSLPLWLLVLIIIGVLYYTISAIGFNMFIINFGLNMLLLLLQLVAVFFYFSLKHKKFVNVIDTYIGLGDILFFISCAVVFAPINFLIFQITSLLIAAAFFGLYFLILKPSIRFIPLAGVQALLLIFIIIAKQFGLPFNFFDDSTIIQFLL